MTRKLLVTIALGATFAIIAAGTAISGTISVGQIQVNVPDGQTTTTQLLPQCADLSDNDGGGSSGGSSTPSTSGGTIKAGGQKAGSGGKGLFGKQAKQGKGAKQIAEG